MTKHCAIQSTDCLIWQTLASVLIPGYVIHQVVKATKWLTKRRSFAKIASIGGGKLGKMLPVTAGLCTIPFIVQPIDHGVDLLMNHTFRKVFPSQ